MNHLTTFLLALQDNPGSSSQAQHTSPTEETVPEEEDYVVDLDEDQNLFSLHVCILILMYGVFQKQMYAILSCIQNRHVESKYRLADVNQNCSKTVQVLG